MTLNEIREKLADKIPYSDKWGIKLLDTNPGPARVGDWEVELSVEDVHAHIPTKTFNFTLVDFSFDLMMGDSDPEDGLEQSFKKNATGKGTFEFTNNNKDVEIVSMEIEMDLELYGDKR